MSRTRPADEGVRTMASAVAVQKIEAQPRCDSLTRGETVSAGGCYRLTPLPYEGCTREKSSPRANRGRWLRRGPPRPTARAGGNGASARNPARAPVPGAPVGPGRIRPRGPLTGMWLLVSRPPSAASRPGRSGHSLDHGGDLWQTPPPPVPALLKPPNASWWWFRNRALSCGSRPQLLGRVPEGRWS